MCPIGDRPPYYQFCIKHSRKCFIIVYPRFWKLNNQMINLGSDETRIGAQMRASRAGWRARVPLWRQTAALFAQNSAKNGGSRNELRTSRCQQPRSSRREFAARGNAALRRPPTPISPQKSPRIVFDEFSQALFLVTSIQIELRLIVRSF